MRRACWDPCGVEGGGAGSPTCLPPNPDPSLPLRTIDLPTLRDGSIDPHALHEGTRVHRGTKWILNRFLTSESVDLGQCSELQPATSARSEYAL